MHHLKCCSLLNALYSAAQHLRACRRSLNIDLLHDPETAGSEEHLSLDPEPRKRRKLAKPGSANGKAAAPVDAIVPETEPRAKPSAKEVPTSAKESTPKGTALKRRPDQVAGAVTPRRCCHDNQQAILEEMSVQETAWQSASAERLDVADKCRRALAFERECVLMKSLGKDVECVSRRTSRAALKTEEEELALALALSMEAAQPRQDSARAGAVP